MQDKQKETVSKEKLTESLSVVESYIHQVLVGYSESMGGEHIEKALHKANTIINKGKNGNKISDMLTPLILAEFTMRAIKSAIERDNTVKEA